MKLAPLVIAIAAAAGAITMMVVTSPHAIVPVQVAAAS